MVMEVEECNTAYSYVVSLQKKMISNITSHPTDDMFPQDVYCFSLVAERIKYVFEEECFKEKKKQGEKFPSLWDVYTIKCN